MNDLLHTAGSFWWLVFPLGGVVFGGIRRIAAANERRADRRLERYRIKQQTRVAVAEASGWAASSRAEARRDVGRAVALHDGVERRWLEYELDVAKLLDFPLMTDMREPLTAAFHRARGRADLLRPAGAQELGPDAAGEYRDAVHELAVAFDVAEAEARRRRRSDFSASDRDRLDRAARLLRIAADPGATAPERRRAHDKATAELAGLVELPAATRLALERAAAGELEAG